MRRTITLSLVPVLLVACFSGLAVTSCGGQAAEKSQQAATYRAYVQAVTTANVPVWKTLVTAKQLEMFRFWCEETKKRTPDQYVAGFPVVQDALRFTGLRVSGNDATLRVTGKRKSGAKVEGEVLLTLENGAWKIAAESYDN